MSCSGLGKEAPQLGALRERRFAGGDRLPGNVCITPQRQREPLLSVFESCLHKGNDDRTADRHSRSAGNKQACHSFVTIRMAHGICRLVRCPWRALGSSRQDCTFLLNKRIVVPPSGASGCASARPHTLTASTALCGRSRYCRNRQNCFHEACAHTVLHIRTAPGAAAILRDPVRAIAHAWAR
jgi:hypothetical protein